MSALGIIFYTDINLGKRLLFNWLARNSYSSRKGCIRGSGLDRGCVGNHNRSGCQWGVRNNFYTLSLDWINFSDQSVAAGLPGNREDKYRKYSFRQSSIYHVDWSLNDGLVSLILRIRSRIAPVKLRIFCLFGTSTDFPPAKDPKFDRISGFRPFFQ